MSANGRKLFLGGLTKTTTTEQLVEIFGHFGSVVDAVVMERNGAPRGFGFVTFKEKSSLSDVIAHGVTIDGREVDVKRAVPEEEMAFAPSKVFVGGLTQKVDKQVLKDHFEQFGDVRDAVVMIDRATARSRGFGFVRFSAPEAVARVLAEPQMIDGQYVDVKRAEPADSLPPPQYPRTRGEEKEVTTKTRRRRRGKRAGAGSGTVTPREEDVMHGAAGLDMAALSNANWAMWSLLSLGGAPGMPADYSAMQAQAAQHAYAQQSAFNFPPFGAYPAYPGTAMDPAYSLPDMAGLFAQGMPGYGQRAAPMANLHVKTDLKVEALKESSPFGDLSNVLGPSLSPDKNANRAVSPPLPFAKNYNNDMSGMVGENSPTRVNVNSMKTLVV